MDKEKPEPAPGRLQTLGTGLVHTFAAVKTALYAALASVLIGLGLSSALAIVVSRWLTASLDAAERSGFSLLDTITMFLGSHLITVRTSTHAAFLSIDVTLKAGLIILLFVPLVSLSLGTLLFTWRFRSRAKMSPLVYAALTGLFYALALTVIAVLTGGYPGEALVAGLLLGVPFSLPAAYAGRHRTKPPAKTGETVMTTESPVAPIGIAEVETSVPEASSVSAQPTHSVISDWLPGFALGVKTMGLELVGLGALSLLTFAIDGSARTVLLLPNLAVYAMALLHGVTVSVLSNLERIGNLSASVVRGLSGAGDGLAAYSRYRFLVVLIPLAVLIAGGYVLERRRRAGRLISLAAFAIGYGGLGAALAWACDIRLTASGAAVALLSVNGTVNVSVGAPWWLTLLFTVPAALLVGWLGTALAGRRAAGTVAELGGAIQNAAAVRRPLFARWAAVISAVLIIAFLIGSVYAAPRLLPVVSGLLEPNVETFSVALPDLEQGAAIAELPGGGYAVAGYAAADPGAPMIVAIDAKGTRLWAATVDFGGQPGAAANTEGLPEETSPPQSDQSPDAVSECRPVNPVDGNAPLVRFTYRWTVRFITVLPDGDIALAGSRLGTAQAAQRYTVQSAGPAPTSEDAYVARLDTQGRPLWVAVWRDAVLSPSGPLALAVQPGGGLALTVRAGRLGERKIAELAATADGLLSLAATRDTNPIAGLGPDTLAFAALGEEQCVALAAAKPQRGGTIVCGYATQSAVFGGGQRAFLALLDDEGNLQWLRSPASADMPSLSAVLPAGDGGFAAVGIRGSSTWMIKTNRRGLIRQESETWK